MRETVNKISVVLPTVGRPGFLDQSIESLLQQGMPFNEIVVFDNSRDHNARNGSKFASDDRIRWECSSIQLPAIQSWNAAVSLASYEWVTIFGDDDIADPVFSAELRELLQVADLALIPFRVIDANGSIQRKVRIPKSLLTSDGFRYARMHSQIDMVVPGFGFKKSAFTRVGGFADSGLPKFLFSDDLLWYQLAQLSGHVACGQVYAWNYRVHAGQIGRNFLFRDFSCNIYKYLDQLEKVLPTLAVPIETVFPPAMGRNGYGEELAANRLLILLDQDLGAKRGRLLSSLRCFWSALIAPISNGHKAKVIRRVWASLR